MKRKKKKKVKRRRQQKGMRKRRRRVRRKGKMRRRAMKKALKKPKRKPERKLRLKQKSKEIMMLKMRLMLEWKLNRMQMQKPRKNQWKVLTQKLMVVMRNNAGIIYVKTKHSKTIHISRTYFRAVCRDISHTLIIWNCVVSHTCVITYDGRDLTTRITHIISKKLTEHNYYACNFSSL